MKPEIMLKLKKDNPLTEKECEQLDSTIQSVGSLNNKNQYELNYDIMVNDVKEDWPFYSAQDKIVVKRNIANFKQKQLKFSASSAFSSINKPTLDDKKNSPLKGGQLEVGNGKVTPNFSKQRNQFQRTSISPGSPDEKDLGYGLKNQRSDKSESYSDFKRLKPNGNVSNQREDMKVTDVVNSYDFSK